MVEKEPLITTIIPTFRRPRLLERAIKSVLNQTEKNVHIAVFDNHSGDETSIVVERLQKNYPNISCFIQPKQIKATENIQFGFSKVNTPFFSILSDDDFLLPNFYEIALNGLKKYSEAQFFVGSTLDVNQYERLLNVNALKWPTKELIHPPEGGFLQIQKYINWTGTLFRKKIAEQNKIDLEVNAIDYDFMIRVSAKYPFVFSKQSCACFVQHQLGYSSFAGLKLFWPSFLKIIANAKQNFSEKDSVLAEKLLIRFFKRSLFGIGCRALKLGLFNEVREIVSVSQLYGIEQRFLYIQYLNNFFERRSFFCKCFGIVLFCYQRIKAFLNRRKFLFSNRNLRYNKG